MSNSDAFEAIKAAAVGAGFVETGGGDDFDMYVLPPTAGTSPYVLYLYEDGRWEHHDFTTQDGDTTEEAQAHGTGAQSLKDYLSDIDVIE
jgi:hypothetical protein